MSDEMWDYSVDTKVSFLLTFNSPEFNSLIMRDVQNAFAAHIKSVFEKDHTLREYISGNLDFWCQGHSVKLHYKFECHDESRAEAESFSRYCVECVRKEIEAFGCKIQKIECAAEEMDMSWMEQLEDAVFGPRKGTQRQAPAVDQADTKTDIGLETAPKFDLSSAGANVARQLERQPEKTPTKRKERKKISYER